MCLVEANLRSHYGPLYCFAFSPMKDDTQYSMKVPSCGMIKLQYKVKFNMSGLSLQSY